jgi:hypothetical protein
MKATSHTSRGSSQTTLGLEAGRQTGHREGRGRPDQSLEGSQQRAGFALETGADLAG